MREHLYRGRRVDNNELVYGWYVPLVCNDKTIIPNIRDKNGSDWEVIPKTVEQYTGLTDKNGKMIFEGDIIKARYRPQEHKIPPYAIGNVIFENGTFKISVRIDENAKEYKLFEAKNVIAYSIEHNFLDRGYILEVIGNIYENPGLLKGE